MIFISYRRQDSEDIVGRIYDHLAKVFPGQIFMDVDSIPVGVQFPEHLSESLERSRVFLPVIGPGWFGTDKEGSRRIDDPNDFVRIEIEAALSLGVYNPAFRARSSPSFFRTLACIYEGTLRLARLEYQA